MIRLELCGKLRLGAEHGAELHSVLAQPKQTAVLAYLAMRLNRGFQRRDSLLALFWPELDSEHARSALSKSVHSLRRQLGDDVVLSRGDVELAVSPDHLWCDVPAIESAIASGRLEDALALYDGELLDGFHLSRAPEFDQWLERERARLRATMSRASLTLAEAAIAKNDHVAAARWARRANAIAPYDEPAMRLLVTALAHGGDRAGALKTYDDFARLLATELDSEPALESTQLVRKLRATRQIPNGAAADEGGLDSVGSGSAAAAVPRAVVLGPGTQFEQTSSPATRASDALPLPISRDLLGWKQESESGRRPTRRVYLLLTTALIVVASTASMVHLTRRPVTSVTAESQAFLERGMEYLRAGKEKDRRQNWTLAVEMFERSVKTTPDFAAGHAALGIAHLRLFHWGFDRSTARLALAKSAIDRSLALDPDHHGAMLARGWYHEWGEQDYERALAIGRRALARRPDDADAAALVFSASRRLGNIALALPYIDQAVRLSPQTVTLRREVAATYVGLRDYPRARIALDQSLALFPTDPVLHHWKWKASLLASGNPAAGVVMLNAARARLRPESLWRMEFDLHWLGRNYDEALRVLQREKVTTFHLQAGDFPIELMYGMVHRLAGRELAACAAYRSAITSLRTMIQSHPADPWFQGWLAIALAGAGDHGAALKQAALTIDLASLRPDPWANPFLEQEVVLHVYIMAGEYEQAFTSIARLLASRHYSAITREWIEMDPRFDALRSDPRFRRLVSR